MTKVLIVHDQPVTGLVAGPSLRYYELASVLARHHDVTLAVPVLSDLPLQEFRAVTFHHETRESLLPVVASADALLVSWYLLAGFPELAEQAKSLIVDIYIPAPFEDLELYRHKPAWQRAAVIAQDFEKIGRALRAGDFFICGNEPQRDFWLGLLGAHGRLNPLNYEADPTFRNLVDVVSMGIPDAAPEPYRPLKGAREGVASDDFLLVWPGGLWDWLDPLTAIEAMRLVRDRAPSVKLLFPGLRHPQPEAVSFMKNPDAALAMVRRHDLGAQVLFDDWTPYRERSRYLLGADAALSLHFPTVETHMAIRARLLDCIWTGTPVIATGGDVIAEAMAERGLARLVPSRDAEALAEAIVEMRSRPVARDALAERFRELAEQYRWSRVSQPLVSYLNQPHRARDRQVDLPRQMPPAKRWLSDNLLNLPFDQYQRHREAAEVVEAVRSSPETRLDVLDVGGGPGLMAGFLGATDSVIVLDRYSGSGSHFVIGDSARMPFADNCFDFVVALDMLEHIPQRDRLRTIDECIRVARQGFILTAPFANAETVAAERQLFEFIKVALGVEQLQLLEHAANGLPDRAEVEAHLAASGYEVLIKPSGYVERWLAMMLLKHYLMSLPDSDRLHRDIDFYYNQHFGASDRRSPSYRMLLYVPKREAASSIEKVARALEEPADDISAARARTLNQLGLVDGQLAHRMADISREQMIAQLLRQTAERCAVAEAELAAFKDLAARMERRKIVRMMHGLDGLVQRLRATLKDA